MKQSPARPVFSFANPQILAKELHQSISDYCHKLVETQGRCTIALSGGTSPRQLYQIWGANQQFPWDKVDFALVDERHVAIHSPEHNGTMISASFAQKQLRLSMIPTDLDKSGHTLARQYAQELEQIFGKHPKMIPQFDLMLLGMGNDGHTASLFPGTGAVHQRQQWAVAANPAGLVDRISLSLPLIQAAKRLILLASGSEKGQVLARAWQQPDPEIPVSLLPMPQTEYWCDLNFAQALGVQ